MGISGIYKEIGSGQRISLAKLAADTLEKKGRPLRIAIDTSIWLYQVQSSKGGTNPPLRTFYYRLIRLLALAVHPIFVFDGPHRPKFKRNKRVGTQGATVPEYMARQMCSFFSFSTHKAPGEAEAECALLQREDIVDMVWSEDVDTLMFGSRQTIRNWSPEQRGKVPTHVNLYDSDVTKTISGLDREGMVLVALMSGGDYIPAGLPGCGPKVACEAARAGFGHELCSIRDGDIAAMDAWRARLAHELRTNESKLFKRKPRTIDVPDDFPNREVLRFYTHPALSSSGEISALKEGMKKVLEARGSGADMVKMKAEWKRDNERAKLYPSLRTFFDLPVNLTDARKFTNDAFEWQTIGGAKHFIRSLAPALLVRELRMGVTGREGNSLVTAISGTREHASTDMTPEMRVEYVPHKVVPIDLDAEDPEEREVVSNPTISTTSPGSDDELSFGDEGDDDPKTARVPINFDPLKPVKAWIISHVVKTGAPEAVAGWETRQQEKAAKAARKTTRKPLRRAATDLGLTPVRNGAFDDVEPLCPIRPLPMSELLTNEKGRTAKVVQLKNGHDKLQETARPVRVLDLSASSTKGSSIKGISTKASLAESLAGSSTKANKAGSSTKANTAGSSTKASSVDTNKAEPLQKGVATASRSKSGSSISESSKSGGSNTETCERGSSTTEHSKRAPAKAGGSTAATSTKAGSGSGSKDVRSKKGSSNSSCSEDGSSNSRNLPPDSICQPPTRESTSSNSTTSSKAKEDSAHKRAPSFLAPILDLSSSFPQSPPSPNVHPPSPTRPSANTDDAKANPCSSLISTPSAPRSLIRSELASTRLSSTPRSQRTPFRRVETAPSNLETPTAYSKVNPDWSSSDSDDSFNDFLHEIRALDKRDVGRRLSPCGEEGKTRPREDDGRTGVSPEKKKVKVSTKSLLDNGGGSRTLADSRKHPLRAFPSFPRSRDVKVGIKNLDLTALSDLDELPELDLDTPQKREQPVRNEGPENGDSPGSCVNAVSGSFTASGIPPSNQSANGSFSNGFDGCHWGIPVSSGVGSADFLEGFSLEDALEDPSLNGFDDSAQETLLPSLESEIAPTYLPSSAPAVDRRDRQDNGVIVLELSSTPPGGCGEFSDCDEDDFHDAQDEGIGFVQEKSMGGDSEDAQTNNCASDFETKQKIDAEVTPPPPDHFASSQSYTTPAVTPSGPAQKQIAPLSRVNSQLTSCSENQEPGGFCLDSNEVKGNNGGANAEESTPFWPAEFVNTYSSPPMSPSSIASFRLEGPEGSNTEAADEKALTFESEMAGNCLRPARQSESGSTQSFSGCLETAVPDITNLPAQERIQPGATYQQTRSQSKSEVLSIDSDDGAELHDPCPDSNPEGQVGRKSKSKDESKGESKGEPGSRLAAPHAKSARPLRRRAKKTFPPINPDNRSHIILSLDGLSWLWSEHGYDEYRRTVLAVSANRAGGFVASDSQLAFPSSSSSSSTKKKSSNLAGSVSSPSSKVGQKVRTAYLESDFLRAPAVVDLSGLNVFDGE